MVPWWLGYLHSVYSDFFSAEEVLIFTLINGKPQHKTITSSKWKRLNTARLKWKRVLNGAPTKSRREADAGVEDEQEADTGRVEQERELSLRQPRPAGRAERGLGLGELSTPSSLTPDSIQFLYYSGQKAIRECSAARCSQTDACQGGTFYPHSCKPFFPCFHNPLAHSEKCSINTNKYQLYLWQSRVLDLKHWL